MARPTPQTAPADPQIIAANSDLDADFFFEENKGKILALVIVALLAVAGYAFYQYRETQLKNEQAAVSYSAKSEDELRSVISKYPGTIVAGNAQLLLADKLRDANKLDDALKVLSDFTQNSAAHPLIAQGWLSYAGTLELKGDAVKALETYHTIGVQYGASEAAPAALISEARLTQKNGDAKKSKEIYENIVQRFPTSIFAEESKQELAKLGE